MNKIVEYVFLAIGGLSFFTVAFLGFATASGIPLADLAVVGPLFRGPEVEEPAAEVHTEAEEPAAPLGSPQSVQTSLQSSLGVLAGFSLESPYRAADLDRLVDQLKNAKAEVGRRELELSERERQADERLALIDEQQEGIRQMRAELDRQLEDLLAREAELERAKKASAGKERSVSAELGRLFAEGEVDEQSKRLLQFPPDEAARILRSLAPDRAIALLNAIPAGEQWKSYSEAYGNSTP